MTPPAPRPATPSASPESALTRPVLLRAQSTTAGDSTSDKEVRNAPAGESPAVIERAEPEIVNTPVSRGANDSAGCVAAPRALTTTT